MADTKTDAYCPTHCGTHNVLILIRLMVILTVNCMSCCQIA